MATPHASGTAALLLQSKPGITPAQVKELLRVTAKDLGLPADTQGAGRAQAYQAYLRVPSSAPSPDPTPPPVSPPPEAIGCIPGVVRSLWPGAVINQG
jgi:subtilisin family serine protease